MRLKYLLLACTAILSSFSVSYSANPQTFNSIEKSSQQDSGRYGKMSLNFERIGLRELLMMIARDAALKVVLSDGISHDTTTLHLTDISPSEALDFVLNPNSALEK